MIMLSPVVETPLTQKKRLDGVHVPRTETILEAGAALLTGCPSPVSGMRRIYSEEVVLL